MSAKILELVAKACRCRLRKSTQRLVLFAIAGAADDAGFVAMSKPDLLRLTSLRDERALDRAVEALLAAGLLVYVPGMGRTVSEFAVLTVALSYHRDMTERGEKCPDDGV